MSAFKKLPGLKERDIARLGPCRVCGDTLLECAKAILDHDAAVAWELMEKAR